MYIKSNRKVNDIKCKCEDIAIRMNVIYCDFETNVIVYGIVFQFSLYTQIKLRESTWSLRLNHDNFICEGVRSINKHTYVNRPGNNRLQPKRNFPKYDLSKRIFP